MVGDGVDILHGLHQGGQFVGRHVEAFGDFLARSFHILGLVDIHPAGELGRAVDQLGFLVGVIDSGLCLEEVDHLGVDCLVDGGRPLTHPRPAFKPVAGIDDVGVHVGVGVPVFHLVVAVGVLLHTHEDERGELRALVDDLDGGAGVAAADPRVLDVGNLVEISAEGFEEAVAELDRLVLPVLLVLVGILLLGVLAGVERVVGHHLEGHRVPTRLADVVDILHPDTGLADTQRVRRRRRLAAGDQRLEVVDRRLCQQHVVAPAVGGDGVGLDPLVVVVLEVGKKGLAHLFERVLLVEALVVDEPVVLTRRLATQLAVAVARPEERTTGGTLLAVEALRFEVVESILRGEFTHYATVGRRVIKRVPTTGKTG